MISTINPATGEQLQSFDAHSNRQVDSILTTAVEAQKAWRLVPVEDRVQILRNTAKVLRENLADYAQLITVEMGKPITEARAEIEKCALTADYYAENAPRFLSFESIETGAHDSGVVFEPLGVVLAIMPWNYPFWQFFRFVLPALAAGNGAILKHANNVPRSALAVQDVLDKAGLAPGLCATILVEPERVSAIIADDRIAAVTLTGSTQVGSTVAARAGAALKKQVLELGGSDPFIVLADANIKEAARVAVKARFTNAGQACVNAKRFIVDEEIADEFVAEFVIRARELVLGDPSNPATDIGPIARENLRATLHDQVQRTLEAGGRLLLGGEVVDGPGFYYPRPSSTASNQVRRLLTRRPSTLSQRLPASRPPRKQSPWPTKRNSAWQPRCGLRTLPRHVSCCPELTLALYSSTAWLPPIPVCPSEASRSRATVANWVLKASASSRTLKRSGLAPVWRRGKGMEVPLKRSKRHFPGTSSLQAPMLPRQTKCRTGTI
ncbi:aldehyde dehydrogenase family protein [Arthrobacter sp. S2(2024)]|uniref:aldehyde dehydrogenase family protein n=1 Tax=Arthrobacter sp. S2(2024) TaxID=3111911 RepID=UPI003FA5FECA